MEVRTFRAASLQEALRQVRESLGPDASVLHTREIRRHRLGLFPQSIVEVEASLEMPAASRFTEPPQVPHPALDQGTSPAVAPLPTKPSPSISHPSEPAEIRPPANPPATPAPVEPPPAMRLVPNTAAGTDASLNGVLLELLSDLVDVGVAPKIAKELLLEASQRCGPEQSQDPWLLKVSLNQSVAKRLHVSGSLEPQPDEQQVVALVGPTGVGKTTTLAKVAAGFRFDLGCQVGLVTLDTFRLGAVDQLLQYAELISAPLEVVSSPDQVTPALARLRECDLVLLDTAGRAPRDIAQLQLLQEFLRAAQPDATHLVVSACSSQRYVEETCRKFSLLQPTNLLITKLDEAVDFGTWLPFLFETPLPVSYLTTGQHVPQDIVVANPRRLARALLGGDHRESEAGAPENSVSRVAHVH